MWLRIAFALGRTPWELARAITSEQFSLLVAWARVEPWGFEIENFRAAQIANTISRVHGNKTKTEDFYPQIGKPVLSVDKQTQKEQMAMLMALTQNGKPS